MLTRLLFHSMLLIATAGFAQAASRLEVGPASTSAGTIVIPLTVVNEQGSPLAALGADIRYDASVLEKPTVAAGSPAMQAGKSLTVSQPAAGMVRLGIVGFNTAAIPDGVVATVTFARKPGSGTGSLSVGYSVSAAGPDGNDAPLEAAGGVLAID